MPGEGVGGRPLVLQLDAEAPGCERERVVGGVVINVGPEVADDADADGAHGEIVAEGRGSWNRNIAGPAPCSLLLAPCCWLLATCSLLPATCSVLLCHHEHDAHLRPRGRRPRPD